MLRKRVRLKTEELRLVNEILKVLAKYGNLDKVFEKVLQIFYSFWSIDAGFIALKDENGRLRVHTAFGFLPEEVERAIYSKGEGITGLTYQLGIPLYATEDKLINKTGLLQRLRGKELAFYTAPIKVGDKVVGVLGLFKEVSPKGGRVEKILETLSVVGSILGTFLELQEKSDLPPNLAKELIKRLASRWEGEYLFTSSGKRVNDLLLLLDKLKTFSSPVLFSGPAGSGKAVFARLLHSLGSPDRKLEELDTRGLTAERLEELFEEKIKAASGGNLLLRRVEFLPLPLQEKLLGLIREGKIRIFATAGERLEEFHREGKLLPSLYEALKLFEVKVPPLSERKEDIEPLFLFLVEKYRSAWGIDTKVAPEVVHFLVERPPEENIRGLERLVKRLLTLFANKELITLRELELIEPDLFRESLVEKAPDGEKKFTEQLEEEEKRRIIEALQKANYVKSRAAKMLGYTLRQLDYRLKKYGIEVKRER